jgi:type I restriction enzyme S subunit
VKIVPLEQAAEKVVVSYVGPSSQYFRDEGVPFLRTGNVGDREIIFDNLNYVVSEFHLKQKKSILHENDILVSRVISDQINCAAVPKRLDGANCGNIIIIRPGKNINHRYLLHLISSPLAQRTLLKRKVGSAQSVVNTKVLKTWEIPLPPLAEQQRIAAILDKADTLRAKRRAALARLDTLLQATFLDMFGDPVTNPMGWEVREFIDVVDGFQNGIGKNKEYYGTGTKVANIGDLYDWHTFKPKEYSLLQVNTKEIKKYTLERGDLLFVRSSVKREGVAYCSMYSSDELCLFSSFMIRAKLYEQTIEPEFLAFLLRTQPMRLQLINASNTGTITNISQGGLSSIKFYLPPLNLQREFIKQVRLVESQMRRMEKYIQDLDKLFHALQQRAFKGEL